MWVTQLAQLDFFHGWIPNGRPPRWARVQHCCAAPQEVKSAREKEPRTFENFWLTSTLLKETAKPQRECPSMGEGIPPIPFLGCSTWLHRCRDWAQEGAGRWEVPLAVFQAEVLCHLKGQGMCSCRQLKGPSGCSTHVFVSFSFGLGHGDENTEPHHQCQVVWAPRPAYGNRRWPHLLWAEPPAREWGLYSAAHPPHLIPFLGSSIPWPWAQLPCSTGISCSVSKVWRTLELPFCFFILLLIFYQSNDKSN